MAPPQRSSDISWSTGRDLTQTIFIHSGHFYSAPSSPLLHRSAPDYSTDTVSEFHAEAHRQLQVKDLPKVPTWRLERESNPRPSGSTPVRSVHCLLSSVIFFSVEDKFCKPHSELLYN